MLLVCKIPFVSQQHCPHTSHDRTAQMRKQRWNKDMISFLLLFCSDFLRNSCSFYMSHYSQMVTNNYKHSLICLPLSRSAKEAEYKGFLALCHSSGDRQALLFVQGSKLAVVSRVIKVLIRFKWTWIVWHPHGRIAVGKWYSLSHLLMLMIQRSSKDTIHGDYGGQGRRFQPTVKGTTFCLPC